MHSAAQPDDDTLWWQRLLHGEQPALAYFYEKYADWLLKYGLSVVSNRDLVRDSVQELFVQIWTRRANLSTPDSAKYYLMASLRRLILKDVRSGRLTTDELPEEKVALQQQHEREAETIEEEMLNKLQSAIRLLPARQQEVIFLRFFEKLSYEEIATLTGLDYQVLRNTIHRAIKTLRLSLADKLDLLLPLLLLLFN